MLTRCAAISYGSPRFPVAEALLQEAALQPYIHYNAKFPSVNANLPRTSVCLLLPRSSNGVFVMSAWTKARVQVERLTKRTHTGGSSSNETGSLPDAGDSIAGHLFALTLTDDGVGTEHAPSKLWSSRAEFQDTGPSRSVIANPPSGGSVPIADLTNSLNRLMLRSASPSTLPSNELSNTSSSSGSVTPTLVVGGRRLPKRDSHRRTVKALQLLNNVESRIHRCSRLLLKPSDVDYSFLQREVTTLRQATDNVTWIADSVKSKKRMLLTLLQELEAEVSSHLPVLQGPVDINTETQYQPPVERMDVVAQVTLLIGVVCSIIFGIGTTGANFIMSSLSLVLYLAFQKADGALSAAHENVMKQIPSTISGALSKFQLNTKTIQYARSCIPRTLQQLPYAGDSVHGGVTRYWY
ncbi:hypothetical protein PISMIDRAFT_6625 [Pisolithus microcarpus 441]|uniref:Uncharacterized protein n=1 Tax=Pisolithus microcarpus 441 TaxID=765257 RepID=A0A0C9YXP4_9AGAM|nr:hypothetical protein PISMIDRAFT_6625 [Pisolithus microcarpus 441]